jgi:UMF1 family MFS transporter
VTYDLANTILFLGVVGFGFPNWMRDNGLPDSALSAVNVVVGVIVVFAAPWVGSRTDHRGRRLPTLLATTVLAVTATMFLGSGPLWVSFVALGVALIGLNVGSAVYDALLPDVSTPATRGRISGIGVGVGYVGSFIGLGIGFLIRQVLGWGHAALFIALGSAFLVFSIPTFLFVRERPRPPTHGPPPGLSQSMGFLVASWRRASGYPHLVRFLVSRFLYTDALNTLLAGFLALFAGDELGLSETAVNGMLLVAIAAAIPGGLAAGRLIERFGPLRVLRTALLVAMIGIGLAVVAGVADQPELVWAVGPLGGAAIAAIWSADRVLMARLSPPRYFGEFYGLYATVGRFATILGPFMWGLVADILDFGQNAAMGALICFLVAGLIGLSRVEDRETVWAQEDSA